MADLIKKLDEQGLKTLISLIKGDNKEIGPESIIDSADQKISNTNIVHGTNNKLYKKNETTQEVISGNNNIVSGKNNEVLGNQSLVIGKNNTALGDNQIVLGSDNTADNDTAIQGNNFTITNKGEIKGAKYFVKNTEAILPLDDSEILNTADNNIFKINKSRSFNHNFESTSSSNNSIILECGNAEIDGINYNTVVITGSKFPEVKEEKTYWIIINNSDILKIEKIEPHTAQGENYKLYYKPTSKFIYDINITDFKDKINYIRFVTEEYLWEYSPIKYENGNTNLFMGNIILTPEPGDTITGNSNIITGSGNQITNNANYSFIGGYSNTISANTNIIFGTNNQAIAPDGKASSPNEGAACRNMIVGYKNIAKEYSQNNIIGGSDNKTYSINNIISGGANTAYGNDNIISGEANTAYGNNNIVSGSNNKIETSGSHNIINGIRNTIEKSSLCLMLGRANKISNSTRPSIICGQQLENQGNDCYLLLGNKDSNLKYNGELYLNNEMRELPKLCNLQTKSKWIYDYESGEYKWEPDINTELPIASTETLGGIKIGTGLKIDNTGVLSVTGESVTTVEKIDWNNVENRPSVFTPEEHTHAAADISGLATVATSGSYENLTNKPLIPTLYQWSYSLNKDNFDLVADSDYETILGTSTGYYYIISNTPSVIKNATYQHNLSALPSELLKINTNIAAYNLGSENNYNVLVWAEDPIEENITINITSLLVKEVATV